MDIANIFREDNDFNIVKSWLCGSTDGQTYSICEWYEKKLLDRPEGVSRSKYDDIVSDLFCCTEWEDSIGYKHDYKVDDPAVDEAAREVVERLNAFIDKTNAKIRKLADEDEDGSMGMSEAIDYVSQMFKNLTGRFDFGHYFCNGDAVVVFNKTNEGSPANDIGEVATLLSHLTGWTIYEITNRDEYDPNGSEPFKVGLKSRNV